MPENNTAQKGNEENESKNYANEKIDNEQKEPETHYKLLTGDEICKMPAMSWLVRDIFPMEGIVAIYGSTGSCKTFLALGMACDIADDSVSHWFARRIKHAPIAYVWLEGEAGLSNRVKAWCKHYNKHIPDKLRFIITPFNLLNDANVNDLANSIIAVQGKNGVVIIDTLNRATPGMKENDSQDMGFVIAAATKLQKLIGGLVLVVHHNGKDETKGIRGHSSLPAALDGAIEVKATNSRRTWKVAKSKDGITGKQNSFKLEIVPLGNDEYGDPITSCVVMADDSAEVIENKKPSLGSNQQMALDVLTERIKSSTSYPEYAPKGQLGIQYDDAVSFVAERMTTDKKHQKSSAKTAITGLVNNGYLGFKGDWLWLE